MGSCRHGNEKAENVLNSWATGLFSSPEGPRSKNTGIGVEIPYLVLHTVLLQCINHLTQANNSYLWFKDLPPLQQRTSSCVTTADWRTQRGGPSSPHVESAQVARDQPRSGGWACRHSNSAPGPAHRTTAIEPPLPNHQWLTLVRR